MTVKVEYPRGFFSTALGFPLNSGKVYVGVANQDPEVNPIDCFWDVALTQPVTQPISITGGYITNSGARASVFVDGGAYSIRIRDASDAQVDYIASTGVPDTLIDTAIDLGMNTVTGTLAEFNAACSDADFATAADVAAVLPSGVILLWHGSVGSIPAGWVLCNGANGTPDLRSKFVVGAGSAYAVAASGGSADATLVSHTHTASVTDPGHTHNLPGSTSSGGINQTQIGVSATAINATSASATTGISVTNSTVGSSATNANLPPYYALCYIMKT